MLQKWKLILTNWINCYFKESNKKDLTVNLETLLDIISHLRENLNTSFSNSSLLDAHTVQEFIVEKYPDFKFENGSVEPDSEEDIYLAASLLLFFVCLNSKNVDLKNAMCSKLSPGDQETILKFSKHLMECSKITHSDIEAAITEACGQDIATPEPAKLHVMVAETPPAIRSYHSEVRRLQAALDAERFDRTYLQEELTRTNLKVEKLLKDKEQYKLEIVNLKAQISQCCGQDKEAQGDDIGANNTTKLVKQLEDMELKLVNTQEQLEDVQYERDNYKSKLTQLKSEHDNLLALSQQQSSRMNTLAEELETERRQTQTLRDLVAELRQHNSLNRMDSSFLECDDPDASIHSLHHNSSACSEVCANVIEVQLGEERAKIVSLKQQIQLLQDQLNEMSRKTEEEKQTLRQIVSEKERNIMDLKHRINEEIEEKNTLKAIFNDDVATLNNERNELEQRLKGCQENSRQIIDKKILEIQNLKEQKISLLHSLSGKTTKLESIIRDLQYEIDAEKSSKIKLREEYDSHIMKLNEKVLNRNNELVELQNKIVQKGEEIEQLQLEIRKEKELRDQQLNKHNNDVIQLNRIREQTEQELQKKTDEVLKLHSDLQQHICIIEQMNKESNYQITDLYKQNNDLELEKNEYLSKINEMTIQFEARAQKENNERTQLKHDYQNLLEIFEKKKSEILNLETIMTNEKQQCKQLLDDIRKENLNLIDKCEILQESQTTAEIELKERQEKIENLNAEIKQLQELSEKNLKQRDEQIALLQKEKEEFRKHGEELKEEKEKLKKEIEYKVAVVCELRQKLEDVMKSETESINLLAKENDLLKKTLAVKESYVASLEKQSNELKIKVDETETKLKNELEKSEKELYNKSEQHNNIALRLQERIQICNQTQAEVQALTRQVADLDKQKHTLELEKNELLKKFEEMKINHETHVQSINNELTQLKHDNQYLLNDLETKKIEITKLESLLNNEIQQNKQLQDDNNNQIQLLANRCDSLQEYRVKTEKELENKEKEIVTLNTEIKQLQEKNEKILQEKAEHINQMKQEKDEITNKLNKELNDQREKYLKETESKMAAVCELRTKLDVMRSETDSLDLLTKENELLKKTLSVKESYVATLEKQSNELKIQKDAVETEMKNKLEKMEQEMHDNLEHNNKTEALLQEKNQICNETQTTPQALNDQISDLQKQKNELVLEKNGYLTKLEEMKAKLEENTQKENELSQLKQDHQHLLEVLESKKSEILNLETIMTNEKQQCKQLLDDIRKENLNLIDKCEILQESQTTAEIELKERQEKIENLNAEIKQLQELSEKNLKQRDEQIALLQKEKEEFRKHGEELKEEKEKLKKEIEYKVAVVCELRQKLEDVMKSETESINLLAKENDLLKKTLAVKESYVASLEKQSNELKIKVDETETKLKNELEKSEKELYNKSEQHNNIALRLQERIQICNQTQAEVQALTRQVADLDKQKHTLELEKNELLKKFEEMKINHETHVQSINNELTQLKHDNQYLLNDLETKKIEITKLESLLNNEIQQNKQLQDDNNNQIQLLANRCDSLQEYRVKTEKELENKEKEIVTLNTEIKQLQEKNEKILQEKAEHINQMKQEKDEITNKLNKELNDQREKYLKETESKMAAVCELRTKLDVMRSETDSLDLLTKENELLKKTLSVKESYVATLEKQSNELKIQKDAVETELKNKLEKMEQEMHDNLEHNNKTEALLQEKNQICNETQTTLQALNDQISDLQKQKNELVLEKNEYLTKLEEMKAKLEENTQKENELSQLKQNHQHLLEVLESKKSEIINLESLLMYEKQQNKILQDDNSDEKRNFTNKCSILQEYQSKAELELERRQKEIETLSTEMKQLQQTTEKNMREQDELLTRVRTQNYELINKLSKELLEEREKCLRETELKSAAVYELRQKLQDVMKSETDSVKLLRKENELLKRTLAIKESFAVAGQEKSSSKSASQDADAREHHQVDNTSTDHSHSSLESYKTISDLEKILQDRNRTITSLQSDITYMKSLLAESEINLLDVTKDLEVSKENCHQLSNQLKKIVHQKNEEIADLKKQVAKMSVNENRASQIIKVSAKYQAIILKRIAEIKSNTVLKELTNFGNTANCDTDLRRSLNAGTVTMEDLENFLDTTDRHLRRCSEKQLALQKERDRLAEVNKINESEVINMKKFLTELSVSIKTFNSVKELYTQKLSRVISLQRTVKREILSLDGRITDATMCRLQRDYASVMQDLTECAMNLERWVERCLGRAISAEKIKQAFSTEERPSLAPTFQNASLEVQLEELENYFCKLLEEVSRAQKGDGAKDAQAVTVMEVRAEYEDKLNRMKAKMKQLYQEQIGIFKEKQREEIVALEEELQKARDKLAESSRAYEEHIKALTTELWNVGEKFLMKKNEAEWLRRKQRHGSLMSLQHVHSSGLVPPQEEPSRPSDTHSLRSLPVATNSNNNNNKKNEGRGLHMSDEEGEVFDNRCLRELATTPGRDPRRLSELQWRNSLCPPHLKSSYPVETQFVPAVHEEDIKCVGAPSMAQGGRTQRKEVGITAYKKPGPPTPSKQAGRLSATDSELRESLRVEMEPNASRKTSTPSRIRALFRSSKAETLEGTPRSRRLSNIFRKK